MATREIRKSTPQSVAEQGCLPLAVMCIDTGSAEHLSACLPVLKRRLYASPEMLTRQLYIYKLRTASEVTRRVLEMIKSLYVLSTVRH